MKPIILNMTEMSDSKEVYESRPHPFVTVFIYLVLTIVIAAIIWAAFFKLDIVVKGSGIVSAFDESSTVTNTFAGNVLTSNVKDGEYVEKGEILYTVATDEYDLQEEDYTAQLNNYNNRIEAIQKYLDWLYDDSTDLNTISDNPYIIEYIARQKIICLNIEQLDNQLYAQDKNYDAKVSSNEDLIKYYNDEINKLNLLVAGIQTLTNPFDSSDSYYYAKMNQYLSERNNLISEYDDSVNKLNKEINQLNSDISEQKSKTNNADDDIKDINEQINILEKEIEEIREAANRTVTVTQEAIDEQGEKVLIEVEKPELSVEEATEQIQYKENKIAQLESSISTNETKKSTAESLTKSYESSVSSKQSSISTAELQKANALDNLEKENIASIEASILNYKQSIANVNGTISETQNAQNVLLSQGIGNDREKIIQNEVEIISEELTNYKAQAEAIESKLMQVASLKDNAVIKAPISGTINLSQDIIPGNYINSGVAVLTIIPEGENLKVESYISNADIAKISPDMNVKYEISAFPSNEYGNIQGKVEFVSADLKANLEDGSAYYLIESTIANKELYNSKGEAANLKVGMACQTKIIVDKITVLRFLLEKIHLID